MAQKVSDKGLVEIASHEGIVNAPYKDSVGVWTVGIGHTAAAGFPNPALKRGEYSMTEIMEIFRRDIAKFEARVRAAFTRPLTQEQFDAAVSFDFNTGGIDDATWVKKFNAGDMPGARKAFMYWSKPKEIIPRREKERDLFFSGKYSSGGFATLYPANSAGSVLWGRGKRVDVIALMGSKTPAAPQPAPKPRPAPQPVPTPAPEPKTASKTGLVAVVVALLAAIGAGLSQCGVF